MGATEAVHGVLADEGSREEGENEEKDENSINSGSPSVGSYKPLNARSISITKDGKKLAAAIWDKVVVWELSGPNPKRDEWEDEENCNNALRCVEFSQDGKLLASSAGTRIAIWDAETHKVIRRIPESSQADGHQDGIDGLAFSHDSKFLASGSDDYSARVWDVETGTTLAILKHSEYVNTVCFSADGTYLATGSSDSTIGIWERPTSGGWGCGETRSKPDKSLRGHTSTIMSVAFAPRGWLLASAGTNGELRIWDTKANVAEDVGDQLMPSQPDDMSSLTGHTKPVCCVAISPDDETVASASEDGVILLWDENASAWERMPEEHSGTVKALVFSQGG
ncbi:WD40-repeat-containing domain protein [Xylaria sp. FL0043]|nr:WD40-repeat-containing domain protein [Xylaria sp. FL0043]